ncbi:hypothetical protein MNBD_GAMMA07-453 [hydrothermal vent metagenome]|uniref:Uncharacterized protein n=1 Tax=hydrothermal vent metagenome TaxID=652676 RepID=A0A3B0XLI1_9ZZZZ
MADYDSSPRRPFADSFISANCDNFALFLNKRPWMHNVLNKIALFNGFHMHFASLHQQSLLYAKHNHRANQQLYLHNQNLHHNPNVNCLKKQLTTINVIKNTTFFHPRSDHAHNRLLVYYRMVK